MSESSKEPNRLVHESSPYLLQHAYNPVDWYPWGPEALARAKAEEKLILLSIGYSACHWCHVMERESFEDEEIAQKMNSQYICVKVDREERPDLDKIYQLAHQLFNQRGGGWPLTMFLTPDEHTPIFAGTYFPKTARMGMPGFGELLDRIAQNFQVNRDKIPQHNKAIKDAFLKLQSASSKAQAGPAESLLNDAVRELEAYYDPVYGGFGDAPKFPHSTQYDLLLAYSLSMERGAKERASAMKKAVHTLQAMAHGGLYDQIGGGFYRYSVDAKWEIPHFEKMLYDSALLMPVYVDYGFVANRPDFHEIASGVAEWVLSEMQSSTGGYYSALDADSEGHEGKYYVWERDELQKLLTEQELRVFEVRYGLRGTPNFEGKWHLSVVNSLVTVVERTGFSRSEVDAAIASGRQKLHDARSKRIRPGLDDKVLASWNGLMIKAMAKAGRMLHREEFVQSAERAVDYVRDRMWKDGRLLAASRGDKAHLNAYLDDYVFMADGVFELLQARWRDADYYFMLDLIEAIFEYFQDQEFGAFYFTSDDHEELLYRSLPTHDDATPSGNGVFARLLLRVGHTLGDLRYTEEARSIVSALQDGAKRMPSSYGSLVCASEEAFVGPTTVLLQGDTNKLADWLNACVDQGPLNMTILAVPSDSSVRPGALAQLPVTEETNAYLCSENTCSPPFDSLVKLLEALPCREQLETENWIG